jgi:hypothetical protein
MNSNRRRIVTLLSRFENACDAARARTAEAADLDAGFDAGEFSGPAHERAFERECDAIAQRLGFTSADVVDGVRRALGVRPHGTYTSAVAHGFAAPLPQ